MTDEPRGSAGPIAPPHGAPAPEAPVPRLQRGRGIRLSGPQLVRIAGTATVLVVLLVMQKPCARAVSNFVTSFDGRGTAGKGAAERGRGSAAGSGVAGSGAPADYEHLRPGMTDDEIKATIERARAKSSE